MKIKNIFKTLAMMALVLFASCSKEEINDSQNNGLITLTVPAIQGFGDENVQSRTVFDLNGEIPKVAWEVGDIIYIGYINTDKGGGLGGKSLTYLKEEGLITEFKCMSVDEDTNIATFEGSSIVENANIAIYTKIPEKVTVYYKGTDQYGLKCNVNEVPISVDNSHLAGNDLLVSVFNTTDKKLNFKRVFGLVKFEFTFPEAVSGSGTFSCDQLKLTGTANIEIATGKIGTANDGSLSISDISVNGNSITFYSLTPFVKITKNTPIIYNWEIGGKKYSATKTYEVDMRLQVNKATKISADLQEVAQ